MVDGHTTLQGIFDAVCDPTIAVVSAATLLVSLLVFVPSLRRLCGRLILTAEKTRSLSPKSSTSDARNKLGWGYKDTFFDVDEHGHMILRGNRYEICGNSLSGLQPFIESKLQVSMDSSLLQSDTAVPLQPPRTEQFHQVIYEWLKENMPLVSIALDARYECSHGQTHVDMFALKSGQLDRIVDVVVYPESEDDVVKLYTYLSSTHLADSYCVLPVGGRTNVTNALSLSALETRFVIAVCTERMNRVLHIDHDNAVVTVQSGVVGVDLDRALQAAGWCLGHVPDSNEFSTVGGWISTKASGMKQSRYGNIEDVLLSVRMVMSDGTVLKHDATHSRVSVNFDINQLCLGSEGMLGVITSAKFRLTRPPAVREYGSILFHSFEDGTKFLRDLAEESEQLPASIRLMDNNHFLFGQALKPHDSSCVSRVKKFYVLRLKGFDPDKMVACTIVYEGSSELVRMQMAAVKRCLRRYDGLAAGAQAGKDGYNLTYAIAYIRDFGLKLGVMAESFETTVPWSKVGAVCDAVQNTVLTQHQLKGLPGQPFLSWRISQAYRTGACVYFYYAFSFHGYTESDPADVYSDIELECRRSILKSGGSLSHHHGIGRIRQPLLPMCMDDTQRKISKAIYGSVSQLYPDVTAARNGIFGFTEIE